MIEKLKEVYPSLVEAKTDTIMDTDKYNWYSTPDYKIIGIQKEQITEKESYLLDAFLSPYYANHPPVTKREEQWINVLFNKDSPENLYSNENYTYKFVYFSLSDNTVDPISFREAIHGLFPTPVPIIWENNHQGIIIEENISNNLETISYSEIINVLTSDFYMNVYLYEGPTYKDVGSASHYYQWIRDSFDAVHQYNKNNVMNYVAAVPYLVLNEVEDCYINDIITSVLKDTIKEEELLDTIRIFLECNSNATLAAKQLYMHRNSLQYRVDKFIEKTGIDVKQFEGALSVYLTLLLQAKMKQAM